MARVAITVPNKGHRMSSRIAAAISKLGGRTLSRMGSFASHKTAGTLVVGLLGSLAMYGNAHATDGYFSSGYGTQSNGIAGAGVAYPMDTLAIANNPAAAFSLGDRTDVALGIMVVDRRVSFTGNTFGPDQTFSGNGGGPIPLGGPVPSLEFGLTRRLGDKWAFGVAVYENGVLTDYKSNPFARFGASGRASATLIQVNVSPTVAYEIVPGHTIGVAVDISDQLFQVSGIQPFSQLSADPAHFSNSGSDYARGYGFKVGYLGQLTRRLSIGAFYRSRSHSQRFGGYAGLLVGGGSFDIPANYGAGIAFKATDRLDLIADVHEIDFGKVPATANPLSFLSNGDDFGTADGPGFGWRNVKTVKLGANYRIDSAWQVRAGWGHATAPIPRSETLLSTLAPAVVQNQFTVGATRTRASGSELSMFVLYAPKETVRGSGSIPAAFGGGEANISLGEIALGIGLGWK
jgi:long-chain fatty acid transport protein